MTPEPDTVLRAMTNDGSFRVITASTSRTVQGVLESQQATGVTARRLGDLVSGAILFRETMAPTLRVQTILRGAGGRGSLIADSNPDGKTRGLVQLGSADQALDLGSGATLQILRTLHGGRVTQGVVDFPETGNVSTALMSYMQASEQVVSTLSVHTELSDGAVSAAGGYLVQLLPGAERGPLMVMTERLADLANTGTPLAVRAFSPSDLMEQLLEGMPYTRLEESVVRFQCWCDEERLVAALSTLGRGDIEDLVHDGQVLEISCDYCGKDYRIAPARLQGLLAKS